VPKGFDQYEISDYQSDYYQKSGLYRIRGGKSLLDTKGNKMAETAFEVCSITSTLLL
jgi:arginase